VRAGILKEVKEALNIVTPTLQASESTINLVTNYDSERKFLILDLSRVRLCPCLDHALTSSRTVQFRCLVSMPLLCEPASWRFASCVSSQLPCILCCKRSSLRSRHGHVLLLSSLSEANERILRRQSVLSDGASDRYLRAMHGLTLDVRCLCARHRIPGRGFGMGGGCSVAGVRRC